MQNRRDRSEDREPRLFSLFATERMEDYAALSIALLVLIIVLIVHQNW
ncbi:hypothetical protein JCM14036_21070 [Desulfotomaculum defluvii]